MKNNRSISARVTQEVVDAFENARKTKGHKYYDRANAYIIKKVLGDWAKKEKSNGRKV